MNEVSNSENDVVEKVYAGCRMCHINCPVSVTVKNGRAIKVEGNPEFGPPNFGKICQRTTAATQWLYSPTRVRYPLKRVGKRGEGKWQRISWEQAVKEIAAKTHEMVEKYGAETFVLPGRTGRHDMGWVAHRIARTIGTPNNYFGPIQVCLLPSFHEQVNFGSFCAYSSGSVPTGVHMVFGHEPSYVHSILLSHMEANRETGTKFVIIDPVQGPNASKADEWVPIRPGTDLAFIMAMLKILIQEDLCDKAFLQQWTNASFLVRSDTGALLLESDVKKGGSEKRYMVWDEVSKSIKYWDTEEVSWEDGPSGKAHYDAIVENYKKKQNSTETSPAAELPENLSPALFGNYTVTLAGGSKIRCYPALQQLAENVEEWTPEKAAEITFVPADQIVRVARMLGNAPAATIEQGNQYMATNASQFFNAVMALRILTGNVEKEGSLALGQFYPVTPQYFPSEYDISYADGMPLETKRKRLGYYEHRIGCGYAFEEWKKWHPMRPPNTDAILCFPDLQCVLDAAETGRPYPVKGIYSISSNFLMHDPTLGRWLPLLEDESKIELHVCTEIVMTPTAELADYVLPAVTWFERNYLSFGIMVEGPLKQLFKKSVEPICEAKHDYEFGAMLAKELGKYDKRYVEGKLNSEWSTYYAGEYGEFWPADTLDGFRDILCRENLGMSFEEALEKRNVMVAGTDFPPNYNRHKIAGKFPTDTGKINLFSTLHQHAGYDPLPVYTEPYESPYSRPDLAKDYPLVLTTGKRQAGFFHSEFRQLPHTREMTRTPDVFINPKTAAEFGVTENDWVWVEAPPTGGRAPYNRIMGKVSFRLMTVPGTVSYSQHGWWRPEKSVKEDYHGALEWNVEALISVEDVCPETGTMGCRSSLCTVYKCSEEDIKKYQPDITLEQLKELMPLEDMEK